MSQTSLESAAKFFGSAAVWCGVAAAVFGLLYWHFSEKLSAIKDTKIAGLDPVNLPIRSIKADVFLIVRGEFFERVFNVGAPLRSVVPLTMSGKDGALAILTCIDFQSTPEASGGRSFSMSYSWPASEGIDTFTDFKYWIDRNNVSTAMLDKELVGVTITIPPTKQRMEVVTCSCVLTINGSIRRRFSPPKTAEPGMIVCTPSKE